jgi:hypothetical protein
VLRNSEGQRPVAYPDGRLADHEQNTAEHGIHPPLRLVVSSFNSPAHLRATRHANNNSTKCCALGDWVGFHRLYSFCFGFLDGATLASIVCLCSHCLRSMYIYAWCWYSARLDCTTQYVRTLRSKSLEGASYWLSFGRPVAGEGVTTRFIYGFVMKEGRQAAG